MIIKLPSLVYSMLSKVFVSVPREYTAELSGERLRINVNREKTLSFALIIVSIILIFADFITLDAKRENVFGILLFIHTALFLSAALFLICKFFYGRIVTADAMLWQVLHIAINVDVLALCSFLMVLSSISAQPPYAYIVAMFSIASMVVLTPQESLLIYAFSYLTNIAAIFILRLDSRYAPHDMLFTFMLMAVALTVANTNYISFTRNFLYNKVIMEKNLELDKLNKVTGEVLQTRTEELNHAFEYEKLRTNFFANISHELRTPISVIFSAQQMMNLIVNGPKVNERKKEINQYTGIIKQNCYRLIRLISNLIDITKLDAGYLKGNFHNKNVVKVVEDITLSIAKYIEHRGISFTFDTESEEIVMAVDSEMLERMILNLLSNAVKFTPEGGEIWVNIYDREDRAEISVKDTGIGIPDSMKSMIFERFVQVDNTNSRSREGSGIGLSLVKSLVELHGGGISLVSEEGKGSEFIICLPKRMVSFDQTVSEYNHNIESHNIEKINIEFSDIYK